MLTERLAAFLATLTSINTCEFIFWSWRYRDVCEYHGEFESECLNGGNW
jgi:hypothetical protein